MCFSVKIDKNIKNIAKRFKSNIAIEEFHYLKSLQFMEKEVSKDYLKSQLKLARKPRSDIFKTPQEDERIYPNFFAPVITWNQGQRVIYPMRYRVRKNAEQEIPSKYNVFNARLDSLETRKTWSNLFLRNHGLFPFKQFYEYVEAEGTTQLISFYPKEKELWAPCLWDYWESEDKKIHFYSFALITENAPAEIEKMGHDRCPIFIEEAAIDEWLQVEHMNRDQAYKILNKIKRPYYEYSWIRN